MVFPLSMDGDNMEEVVIIGGGIAGLSCLNALLDKGISPLLVESNTIGSPKMCGEFLAPQTVAFLQQWEIGPIHKIQQADFFAKNKKLHVNFSQAAGAIARSKVEILLAERARKKNGRIQENCFIEKITPATSSSPYYFYLRSGEKIAAKIAIFATGKLGQQLIDPTYFGVKIHFDHIVTENKLLMYSMQNAYLGIVPISNETSNCACLIRPRTIDKNTSGKDLFYNLISQDKSLTNIFDKVDLTHATWLQGPAPEFGLKSPPLWPNAFWIGDALASLHPAIGSGFAHGISSAVMATTFYLQNKPKEYQKIYTKHIRSKLLIGKWIHQFLLNPIWGAWIIRLLSFNPWLIQFLLKKIDYN